MWLPFPLTLPPPDARATIQSLSCLVPSHRHTAVCTASLPTNGGKLNAKRTGYKVRRAQKTKQNWSHDQNKQNWNERKPVVFTYGLFSQRWDQSFWARQASRPLLTCTTSSFIRERAVSLLGDRHLTGSNSGDPGVSTSRQQPSPCYELHSPPTPIIKD